MTSSSHHTQLALAQQVARVLAGINGQIVSLLRCSSDDFLGLNADLKWIYLQAQAVWGNASRTLQLLAQAHGGGIPAELASLAKAVRHSTLVMAERSERIIGAAQAMLSALDGLTVPIKNMTQNLMALKFLLANLNLTSCNAPCRHEVSAAVEDLDQLIDHRKALSAHHLDALATLRQEVQALLAHGGKGGGCPAPDPNALPKTLQAAGLLIGERQRQIGHRNPLLTARSDSTDRCIARIIINLQYQDIIRQKVEHVEQSQRDTIRSIERLGAVGSPEELEPLMAAISELANLHSAQLVDANRQYQQAIERISASFLHMESDLNATATLCLDLYTPGKNPETLFLTDIIDTLTGSAQEMARYQLWHDQLGALSQALDPAMPTAARLGDQPQRPADALNASVSSLLMALSGHCPQDQQPALARIQGVAQEVEGLEATLADGLGRLETLRAELPHAPATPGDLPGLSARLQAILASLAQTNALAKQLVAQNVEISRAVSNRIGASLSGIKYYDTFEVGVTQIIDQLHRMRLVLMGLVDGDGREQTLALLNRAAQRYTMASEHAIHDQVLTHLAPAGRPTPTEGGDDVEFF